MTPRTLESLWFGTLSPSMEMGSFLPTSLDAVVNHGLGGGDVEVPGLKPDVQCVQILVEADREGVDLGPEHKTVLSSA